MVTMGGLGSVIGAFVSGIVLGLMETVGAVVVGSSFKDTIVFLAFILILVEMCIRDRSRRTVPLTAISPTWPVCICEPESSSMQKQVPGMGRPEEPM